MVTEREEWRPIPSCPGYEASNLGRIRSVKWWKEPRVMVLRPSSPDGYLFFSTSQSGHVRPVRAAAAVLEAFVGPRPPGLEIRHLDGEKTNNALTNLRYGTHVENVQDQLRHGTHTNASKTHCPQGHAYDEKNTYIQKRGSRICRKCAVRHGTAYRRRKRLQERAS